MKKLLLLFLTVVSFTNIYAQSTYLEIDNQVPGQLSSKIKYIDQISVKDLIVTGYINNEDLKFIGTLISQRDLHSLLDLSEANIVNAIAADDNYLCENVFNIYDSYLRKIILPKSLTKIDKEWYKTLTIDSIVFDTNVKEVGRRTFHNTKYLFVGSSMETLPYDFAISVDFIEISNCVKSISDFACEAGRLYCPSNDKYEFKELEYLGYRAFFSENEYLPDTLLFPKITEFHIDGLKLRAGMHIYLGENINHVYRDPKVAYKKTRQDITETTFHIASMTPPRTVSNPSWTQDITLYVPKDAVETYKNNDAWKFANIIAEPQHVQNVTLNEHKIHLDLEDEATLFATIIPSNADDTNITWISHDESVAIVDENGRIVAVGGGTTTIWAISNDNPEAKDYCEVIVNQPATGITLNESTLTMTKIGESVKLSACVQPENASNKEVRWGSSNPAVCMVSGDGLVIALGEGTSVVTATTADGGFIDICVVTVTISDDITKIAVDELLNSEVRVNVYNLQGKRVVSDVPANKVKNLPKGMYIVNNLKIVIK